MYRITLRLLLSLFYADIFCKYHKVIYIVIIKAEFNEDIICIVATGVVRT